MEKLRRYIPELRPSRIRKNIDRFVRIYVNPPKESRIFLEPKKLPEITKVESVIETKGQPKQVVYDKENNRALVSCMEGRTLQSFKINNQSLELEREITFEDQCVEVLTHGENVFVTTTNFARPPQETRNKLWILDAKSLDQLSSIDTGGNWSKLMAIRPQGDELLISNWHSSDISVVDIKNPKNPKLKQVFNWGEAPRGIAFLPDGNSALVAGFYSGNLGVMTRHEDGWSSTYSGESFDKPNYSGNMRHILISPDSKTAIVSNLGRNLIHFWNIENHSFEDSISVGKCPNSIDYIGDTGLVAVSCRDSSSVYIIDPVERKVLGRSPKTGAEPTGLCGLDSGYLVTDFKANKLELHSLKK